ncbi:hypothetical protein GXM_07957 [Nostoc sphaeroides CCNUC1]|uniref:Uncharacterized protein n=1 Tax=Nostoc sphaeroides CCNUC1 TaxID=2653204 RepID=A0A5P8WCD3_9NOSO|nr:hypothetical protein GXM_07957 [Nostoc sphaeroides CCNUC1]
MHQLSNFSVVQRTPVGLDTNPINGNKGHKTYQKINWGYREKL